MTGSHHQPAIFCVLIKFYWDMATPIDWQIVHGSLYITTTELSGGESTSLKYLLSGLLQKNFADSLRKNKMCVVWGYIKHLTNLPKCKLFLFFIGFQSHIYFCWTVYHRIIEFLHPAASYWLESLIKPAYWISVGQPWGLAWSSCWV